MLHPKILDRMPELTKARIEDLGISNANLNNQKLLGIGKSIRELTVEDRVVVIAAGPSIKYADPIPKLVNFGGTIICTDSAMRYCLEKDRIPDIVVSVDPHDRILRWLGDPLLTADDLKADDYFSRQDMDAAFESELATNRQIIELLKLSQMKLALGTSVSPKVTQRAIDAGFDIYWWNPMYDGGKIDLRLRQMNSWPSMNAGGNVGSSCWMLAQVLGAKDVALTGMDFGYYEHTPYKNTQYYNEAVDIVGKDGLDSIYSWIWNPYVNKLFYTDPAYLWYRNCFLEMLKDATCKTTNCTEGGILFGEGIEFKPLLEWV